MAGVIMTDWCEDEMSLMVSRYSLDGSTQQCVHYSIQVTAQQNAE